MKIVLFATLLLAAYAFTQPPYPDPAFACIQEANDPTWGPFCTQVS